MRVYEFAKKVEVSSKELIQALNDAGYEVKNHMAVLTDNEIALLEKKYMKSSEPKHPAEEPVVIPNQPEVTEPEVEAVDSDIESSYKKRQQVEYHPGVDEIVVMPMTPGDFADRTLLPIHEVIVTLMKWGILAPKNRLLSEELIERLAEHYQLKAKRPEVAEKQEGKKDLFLSETPEIQKRAPIIVVLGHVDHGKTTLLDYIRKTRVAAREKGGITQHLGAYSVQTKHGNIVFLDTPGHEAFTKIRTRGLKVADIAILVVAIDDGVMPQTIEAIKIAKQMEVPIIVAMNKVDKGDGQRIEILKRQLAQQDLLAEDWGGQIVCVPISAKTGQGIDELLEMIDLQAQIMELETDVSGPAKGYVLESKLEKGRGPVATVILQQGSLHVGDFFTSGQTSGKVTSLVDTYGKRLKEVLPGYPVQVAGFDELPQAGDSLLAGSKTDVKKAIAQPAKQTMKMARGEKSINICIKADTNSSIEALEDAIRKLSKKIKHIDFHIVSTGVGDISERDVMLASHTGSAIIGLHIKAEPNAQLLASKERVSIQLFDIIYKLLETLQETADKQKEVKMIDKKVGEAVIRKVFDIKKLGIIAGCYVREGIFVRTGKVVVWRGKNKIGTGAITSLQRDGKSVKEVHTGFECAFMAEGLVDFEVDDRVECFASVPEKQ
jgi:translation initiation factor IF-2